MQNLTMGWDIGGAHLKAAIVKPPQECIAVYQRPCPLWKGLDKLEEAVRGILADAAIPVTCHSLTMTGELADVFAGREEGVGRILETMRALLPEATIRVYAGLDGLIGIEEVTPGHTKAIASANWLASISWTARKIPDGLFVDIGSTTTDILLIDRGKVSALGYTDYRRLVTQELVYTGIVRTAVMAVAQTALDGDNEAGLMAEYFATMADVYRLTGELNEQHDQWESADGTEKSVAASAKRLARMIGCDYVPEDLSRWQRFAGNIRQQQMHRIRLACEKQLSRVEASHAPMIGAGIGSFLVRDLAVALNRPYVEFNDLFDQPARTGPYSVADCAPAVAVACLTAER